MKELILGLLCMVTSSCGGLNSSVNFTDGGVETLAAKGSVVQWSFDGSEVPEKFFSVLGEWRVEDGVLRQKGTFHKADFPRIFANDTIFEDVRISVRCRPESGSIDQACGLIIRAQDSSNYYIARTNALEGNVRFYHIVNDERTQLATAEVSVAKGVWHELALETRGQEITVLVDGAAKFRVTDGRFRRGNVGLWTKADSISAFDDLRVEALGP